jgi:hypothetical protein
MTATCRDAAIKIDRIVCLDREHLCLFAEVIETIEMTSRYWVRPLAIAAANADLLELEIRHDLREAAQLILPIALFRDALDTEVLPLIGQLWQLPTDATSIQSARQALHDFIAAIYASGVDLQA